MEDIEDSIAQYNWSVKIEEREFDEHNLYEYYYDPSLYPIRVDGVLINRSYSEKDSYYDIVRWELT